MTCFSEPPTTYCQPPQSALHTAYRFILQYAEACAVGSPIVELLNYENVEANV